MPTESELLSAVTAHPDDDAPRIALAKHWGGDRERFVLGQLKWIAAARKGYGDPDMLANERLGEPHLRAWEGPSPSA